MRPRLLPTCLVLLSAALVSACNSEDETTEGTGGGGGGSNSGGADGGGGSGGQGGASVQEPVVLLPKVGLDKSELAILVNDQDPQSVEVGEYYRVARSIPAANVITLSFATGNTMSEGEFATVKAQLDAAVGPNIQGYALTWTTPYRVSCMSVTSAFALGFDTKYCATPCSPTAYVDYFNSESANPLADHDLRPAMSIAAASVADAKTFIDRGIASDDTFPSGDGYLLRTTDTARSVRWPQFVGTVNTWSHPEGLDLTYIDNSGGAGDNFIADTVDVLFYFTGLANVPQIDTNTYIPGAIADHLTSFGGQIPTSGQMSILRWLEAGATGSYGTVVEPCNYTSKFPDTTVVLPHYYRGETLLEAYWKSVATPGEGIFIGEPLARPWGATTVDYSDGEISITTTMLKPLTPYEIAAGQTADGPFTVVKGDIGVDKHQLTTITYSPTTEPFYKLRKTGSE